MQFRQKYSPYETTFNFDEEELTYTFEDSKNKIGNSIAYHLIPHLTIYTKKKRWDVLWVLIFCVVLCVTMGIYSFIEVYDARFFEAILLVPMVSVIYITAASLRKSPVGVFAIPVQSQIRILEDKQHAAILDEIWKRRKEQIRKKFAQVDFDKPYWEEAQKFNRLREQDIITEQEYQYARQKIAAMKERGTPPLPGAMRMN